jgi:hypothetical protein
MYSPKIPDRFVPALHRLSRARGQPMTQLVAQPVERYLATEGVPLETAPGEPRSVDRPPRRDTHRAA